MGVCFLYGNGGGGMTGATLTVTAPAGVTVTTYKGGKSKTKIAGTDGVVIFKGLESGEWTLTISDGTKISTNTITITADYAITMAFFAATISVTYPVGSTCTATDGVTTLQAPDTSGTWACIVPNAGSWTVSCTDGTKTQSSTVSIATDGESQSVTLAYELYLYKDGETDITWSGNHGTDTSTYLVMQTRHAYNGASGYNSAGWKQSDTTISVPGWASKLNITYSASYDSDNEGSLTSRCFGLMTSKIDKYSSGYIDNYAAGVSVNMGSYITASVPITDAIKGQNFYICLCASNQGQNVIVTSTWKIYKIWFS